MEKHAYRRYPERISGQYNFHRKLTFEEVREIRIKLTDKVSLQKIAAQYQVSPSTIRNIKNGKRYKDAYNEILKEEGIPSITECRYAVLEIKNGSKRKAYVIYDRATNKIVNGVYYMPLEEVLFSAVHYNVDPDAPQNMSPACEALALKYPTKKHKDIWHGKEA